MTASAGVAAQLLRPAWVEIDLDAAAENLRAVRRLVGAQRKIFAVVKAVIDRGAAAGTRRLTGVWPGDEGEPSGEKA